MYEDKTAEEILSEAEEQARRFDEHGDSYYPSLVGVLRTKIRGLCLDRDRGEVIHDED